MEKNKLVVVVDDDIDFREAMLSIFKHYPVDVLGFATGEEASEFLCELRVHPDLIILDVELKIGGLSGVDVAHILRKSCGYEAPILFLSAEPTVDIWTQLIPNSRALSKKNSFRRIFSEITGGHGSTGPALMHLGDSAHAYSFHSHEHQAL